MITGNTGFCACADESFKFNDPDGFVVPGRGPKYCKLACRAGYEDLRVCHDYIYVWSMIYSA